MNIFCCRGSGFGCRCGALHSRSVALRGTRAFRFINQSLQAFCQLFAETQCPRVRSVAGHFGVDKLSPEQLIRREAGKQFHFFGSQFDGYGCHGFLHTD